MTRGWTALVGQGLRRVIPPRHGVRGTVWSEVLYFRFRFWRQVFLSAGWDVVRVERLGLLYTGNEFLGAKLPLPVRRKLGSWLGCATCIWVLRKRQLTWTKTNRW